MIVESLKAKSLELRKARDPLAASISKVLSDAQDLAKADTKDGVTPVLSDEYALRAIRAAIKRADENIRLVSERGGVVSDSVIAEKAILEALLPAQASDADVRAAAQAHIDVLSESAVIGRSFIGPVMKHLEGKFGAALDKGKASAIVRELIG